jgi:hypothetical protein
MTSFSPTQLEDFDQWVVRQWHIDLMSVLTNHDNW